MQTSADLDLDACDREPIRTPGAIQPHGVLIAFERAGLRAVMAAGDVAGRLGIADWRARSLADFLDADAAGRAAAPPPGPASTFLGRREGCAGEAFDVSAHAAGGFVFVEFEPAGEGARTACEALSILEDTGLDFQRAQDVRALSEAAATRFRDVTGFDRVMIYRFLEDESGVVVAESRRADVRSFLNQHFPASDIPRQARELYVRNLVRAIPRVDYEPAPLEPADSGREVAGVDLSDCALRSVSPIHLQYLRNMGVGASASISIVVDGRLWGLVACHHESPRGLGHEARSLCRMLALNFAQQVRAKEESEGYRERLRLSSFSAGLLEVLGRDGPLDSALANHVDELAAMLRADGAAVLRGRECLVGGHAPSEPEAAELARWIVRRGKPAFATDRLSQLHPPAAAYRAAASGVAAVVLSFEEPWAILWFRAEKVETVEWAGNPHKDDAGEAGILTPRASFALWSETVRGRSRAWTVAEVEAAGRLGALVVEARLVKRERELNRRLTETLKDKDVLLEQKEFLIGEVNHRVQNSLQLVSSFLTLQGMQSNDEATRSAMTEANRRVAAVALLHRRLYRGDQLGMVQLARYVEDVVSDAVQALGLGWASEMTLDLAPVAAQTDQAVSFGLILTELLINANKYAYGGAPGPILIRLRAERGGAALTVADRGVGRAGETRRGFGARMLEALVRQLGGELVYEDNGPGLKATLTAPLRVAV